jgi:hypothetical protein
MNAKELIKEMRSGKFFSCEFIKRSNNKRRFILARSGVTIGVTGKGCAYNFTQKNLLPVLDVNLYNKTKDADNSRRAIPLEGVIWVQVSGVKYWVSDLVINESIDKINELNKTILR